MKQGIKMMNDTVDTIEQMDKKNTARLAVDMIHRMILHHVLWFAEIRHHMGMEKAIENLETVVDRSLPILMKRFSKIFQFELEDDLPVPLLEMSKERLEELLTGLAVNWLAVDGIWFQSVEFSQGMNDAKRCNDSCWSQFSPVEAWAVKKFLNLGDKPGLEGLKQALGFRLYAFINKQSYIQESKNSLVFQMNDCRVQSARRRKGLDDYPCKSGGLVEYTYFAKAVDSRIETECIGCPPDDHPDDWFCSWRFKLDD